MDLLEVEADGSRNKSTISESDGRILKQASQELGTLD